MRLLYQGGLYWRKYFIVYKIIIDFLDLFFHLYLHLRFSSLSLFYRNVFEKITTLTLSTKKMKILFKRYLEFEKKYGDETSVEGVKRKAMEYVESKTALV